METIPSLLLASNSPRRRQLLALGGWSYGLDVSDIDETRIPGETPANYVRRLARLKAQAVLPRADKTQIIVGSDTAVVIDEDILGKPANPDDARQMLQRLRGNTHQVYTGIAILRARDGNLWTDVIVTDVPMREYSDVEIDLYIESGDPMDKAGAYGIQNPDFQPVARMQGCFASVMGLPLCSLSTLLRQVGIMPRADVARNCQDTLNYECPVFGTFLRGVV
ncbi:MAG: Maf family protein [Chloroflexi bacterium]|nr:Maf family protein [Chloroflexota bacterium]